jgi:lysozyme
MSLLRPVPEAAHAIAARCEGLRLQPYHDPVGFPTIGYGHLLSREPWAPLERWKPITPSEAHDLLNIDLARAASAVLRMVKVPLTDAQYAALVDFAFNCGAGNLQASTLLRLVNAERHDEVPPQFLRWVYARGVRLAGLVNRRTAEAALYQAVTAQLRQAA